MSIASRVEHKKRLLEKTHRGWYHDTDQDSPGEIWLHDSEDYIETSRNIYGPFATFTKAKADAIDYHKTDLDNARLAIHELRLMKKPK